MGALFFITTNLQPDSFHRSHLPAVNQGAEVLFSVNRYAHNTVHYYRDLSNITSF